MEICLNDVAVYETRPLPDESGYWVRQQRGWWLKSTGRFLGSSRAEAEDTYAIEYGDPHGEDVIVWTR